MNPWLRTPYTLAAMTAGTGPWVIPLQFPSDCPVEIDDRIVFNAVQAPGFFSMAAQWEFPANLAQWDFPGNGLAGDPVRVIDTLWGQPFCQRATQSFPVTVPPLSKLNIKVQSVGFGVFGAAQAGIIGWKVKVGTPAPVYGPNLVRVPCNILQKVTVPGNANQTGLATIITPPDCAYEITQRLISPDGNHFALTAQAAFLSPSWGLWDQFPLYAGAWGNPVAQWGGLTRPVVVPADSHIAITLRLLNPSGGEDIWVGFRGNKLFPADTPGLEGVLNA